MFELPPKRKRGRSPSGSESAPRPPGVHKRGKRIVSLLQTLQRQDDTSLPDAAHAAPDSAGLSGMGIGQPSLLGVPGLTRQALDASVSAFFGSVGHTKRLSQQHEMLTRRVRVMLYETAGLEVPKDLTGVDAASELLALVVAALGASSGPYRHLAQPLFDRCIELAKDSEYLADGGLDVVEAVNLLVDCPRPPHSHTHSAPNPLILEPFDKGYPVELAIYHNVHIRPVQGEHVLDFARREFVFWIVWATDALRSTTLGLPCSLAETDVGWPWRASEDASLVVAVVARHISTALLSTRARCTGLHNEDVRVAINELDTLTRETEVDLAWLRNNRPVNGASLTADQIRVPAFMGVVAARNMLYIVCWAATKRDAALHPRNLSARVLETVDSAAMRATEYMISLARMITESQLSAPAIVATRMIGVVVFLLHKLVENVQKQRPERSAEVASHAQTLISALSLMDCYPDTEAIVTALNAGLSRVTAIPDGERKVDTTAIHDLIALLHEYGIRTPFSNIDI